jgi:hypothetical protein
MFAKFFNRNNTIITDYKKCDKCSTLSKHDTCKLCELNLFFNMFNRMTTLNNYEYPITTITTINENIETIKKRKRKRKIRIPIIDDIIASKDEKNDNICKICYDNMNNTVNLPCGHMIFCTQCANKYNNKICPVCNQKMTEIKKVYK